MSLETYLPQIISLLIGSVGTGGILYIRRRRATTAQLASEEFADVGEMVNAYTAQLSKLTNQITGLHGKVIELEQKVQELEADNSRLQTHIDRLESK